MIANSESVAADARAALGPDIEVKTLLNAVDLDRFSPAGDSLDLDRASDSAPPPSGTIRVGLLGTFARWKGHETFLRAVAMLRADASLRAYVIGGPVYQTDGSQYSLDELRAIAHGVGVADRTVFTGVVDRPDAALRSLDVVVHASTAPEPFGLVIAEAMACARPVVVSRAGGAAELVTPGVDALTHTPGDAVELAGAIATLVANPARRATIARAARQTAERRFDRRRLGPELMSIYASLTAQVSTLGG